MRRCLAHLVTITALALALAAPAAADTIVPGGNVINQTWTVAGSPYVVQGDVTIPSGAFLTIEPGVTVQVSGSDAQASGVDPSKVEITVRGTLTISGTPAARVTVTSPSTVAGAWVGFIVDAAATAARFDHVTINYPRDGIAVAATGNVIASTGLVVQNASQYGVDLQAGHPTFDGYTSINNSYGIRAGNGSGTFTACVLRGGPSASYGLYVRPTAATTSVDLTGCTINAAGTYGVQVNAASGAATTVTIRDSIVTNHSYGVYRSTGAGSTTVNVTYTDVWNNSSANYTNASGGTGTFSSNPLYVSTTNLRLTSNSPARFGGATGRDLGALPYVDDPTPGLYGTLWTSTTLSAAGSPYPVAGDLTIPAGVRLTIQPGVTLSFAGSDLMVAGGDAARTELLIAGAVDADGTPASPITLTSSAATAGAWVGISLLPGATGSRFDQVVVRYPRNGFDLRALDAGEFTAVTVQDASQYGVWLQAGTTQFDGYTSINNSYGVHAADGSGGFRNTIIRGGPNASYGVYVRPLTATTTVTLAACTINAAGTYGVQVNAATGAAASVTIVNSIVTNHSYGVYRSTGAGSTTVDLSYSDVWNNTSANLTNTAANGVGMIASNPLYVSSTNLRLTSNSPARFGGSLGGDLGALPYVDDPTPGLYGTLWTNATLTAAGSPYTVAGDLVVSDRAQLSIQPGVTLSFAGSDLMLAGSDPARAELQLLGALIADGTPTGPITFTSSAATAGAWVGIQLLPGGAPSILDHVLVRYPRTGLDLRATSASTFTAVTVQDASEHGLWIRAGSPSFDAYTSINNSYGVHAADGSASFTSCVVRGGPNASYGVYVRPLTATTTVNLTGCTINAAGTYGVQVNAATGAATTVNVVDAIVTNHSYGVYRSTGAGSTAVNVTYSDVWNNTSANYTNASGGVGTISANPLFVSTTDLRLQPSSVCIDAGTTGPMTDAAGVVRPQDGNGIGGAQWDLGAYEYVLVAMCGNGAIEPGETCDSGADNGGYGACNAQCTGLGPRCGDGMTNGPEQCDDGNQVDTDACLRTCRTATCGDGVVRAGVETCDDGNQLNTDACVGACVAATCGDGFVRTGVEACDDGNQIDTDACRNTCTPSACGDGVVGAGEECDDGNQVATDACNGCRVAVCGDGVIRAGVEQCDDGNQVPTDACTASCQAAICGDGITRAGVEECDDANQVDSDACVTGCLGARCGDGFVRAGVEGCDDGNQVNTDACTNACVSSTCGDGVVQGGVEQCDDANQVDSDGCRNNCAAALCGDGVVRVGVEACDDGNTAAGDGCSPTCAVEAGPDAGPGGPDAGEGGGTEGGGGCCSGASRDGSLLLGLGVLLLVRRRRVREARP